MNRASEQGDGPERGGPDTAGEEGPHETARRRAGWWLVGAAAVLGAGIAVTVMFSEGRSQQGSGTAQRALPRPRPPVTRPLFGPRQLGVGWGWVNPRPRAMPPWYGVDVIDPGLTAMVGHAGEAARFVDERLFRWETKSDASLRDVAWLAPGRALAVGDGGTVRLLSSEEAQAVETPTEVRLWAVEARPGDADGAWIAGADATLLRYGPEGVHPLELPPEARVDLLGLHVGGDRAWVVGAGGTIARIEGREVRLEASGTDARLRAIGGCPDGALYAAGDGGLILRRASGTRWRRVRQTGDEAWAALTCDEGRAVVVGRRGGVRLVAGRRSVALDSGTKTAFHGIAGSPAGGVWLVGDTGYLGRLQTSRIHTLTAGPATALQDAASLGGALVAVGEWGRILRQHRERFERGDSPTELALAAVVPLGAERLLAVGDRGVLVEITWNGAKLLDRPTDASWRDALAEDGEVIAVGVQGTVMRGVPPSGLTVSRIDSVGDLWGVAGRPDDAVAVGEKGAVVRIEDGAYRPIPCEVDATLRDVMRTSAGSWAVGDGGSVVKITDEGCAQERRGGADLRGIGSGPRGRPLAVGRHGTVLQREPGGTWSDMPTDVGDTFHLRAVVDSKRHVYVVGTGGVILRHPKLNNGP